MPTAIVTLPAFHKYADIFPLIEGAEFERLCADVRQHGVREPIVFFEGKVLDGRNRLRAATKVGVECPRKTFEGDDEAALDFVVSLNVARRHLSESQRAMVADSLATMRSGARTDLSPIGERSQEEAAILLNVGKRSVERARTVRSKGAAALVKVVEGGLITVSKAAMLADYDKDFQADVIGKVKDGMKATEALRQVKRERLPATVASLPKGKHRVIYADPPWQYGDARQTEGYISTGAAHHYATMTLDELKELEVDGLAAKDAVCLMWATVPLLPEALEVLKAWGFAYKTLFVWDKGHGAFGHYHAAEAELLLVGTVGACLPELQTKEKQVQRWPRGGHSVKPEAARAMIDKLWPSGRRIELFRRGDKIKGWATWGGEAS